MKSRLQYNANVVYSNETYLTRERNTAEKMLYTNLSLKKNSQYIIETDIDIDIFFYDPTRIYIDFITPSHSYDLEEQEKIVSIDAKTRHKKIFIILNSKNTWTYTTQIVLLYTE